MKAPPRNQIFKSAYREARQAGLDTNSSDAVAHKVVERVVLGGETFQLVVQQEITKHVNP